MNARERLETVLGGGRPDRVPVALWRHFPVDDQDPERLAAAVLAFQQQYDFDLVKVTPASSYMARDWGARDVWEGSPEGTRTYPQRMIRQLEDWEKLHVLDPDSGQLGAEIAALKMIRFQLPETYPLLATVFSPLDTARKLVGQSGIQIHMRRYPETIHAVLKTITESICRFIDRCMDAGVDGMFYAIQHGQYAHYTVEEHRAFGRHYDLQVLASAAPLHFNMLHLHGTEVMFDQVADYPVQIINWHDRETTPDLGAGKAKFPGVVCGGLQRTATMLLGTAEAIRTEALDAIGAVNGERFILGTGCVLETTTPHGNILAARQVVEK